MNIVVMTQEEIEQLLQEGIEEARKNRRFDEKVRQPCLRLMRRLLGIPEPRITVDQAVEIARDYFVTVKRVHERFRTGPMLITSHLRDYRLETATIVFGPCSLWVDMADGRVHHVLIKPM